MNPEKDEKAAVDAPDVSQKASARKPRKWGRRAVGAVVVVAVVALAGLGGVVAYAGTDSYCTDACHTPMGAYAGTYDATVGEAAVDKWGNEVTDASSMLAAQHRDWNAASCVDCHPQDTNRRLTEIGWWLTGDYYYPLEEWKTADMAEFYGVEEDALCLNEACHNVDRGGLRELTFDTRLNPHSNRHGDLACSTCHKAHRASVMQCAGCHDEAEVPEGWIKPTEEEALRTWKDLPSTMDTVSSADEADGGEAQDADAEQQEGGNGDGEN